MKKTLFLAMLIGCCSSALAVDMNVTPDGDGQKVTFTWADGEIEGKLNKTITADKATTIEVEEGKDVTVYGTDKSAGCVYGAGSITKTGEGSLGIRLNDTLQNLSAKDGDENDFKGNVTVERGSMTLLHDTTKATKAQIGGGLDLSDNTATVTVKEGADLYMTTNTGINIPSGGVDTNESVYSPNMYIQVDGGDVYTEAPDCWVPAFADDVSSTARISNAVIDVNGIRNEAEGGRAAVKSTGMILFNQTAAGKVGTTNADIIVDEFYLNGNIELSSSKIYASMIQSTSIRGEVAAFDSKISDHSEVLVGMFGHLTNVDVDATSKLQADTYAMVELIGVNRLEIKSVGQDGLAKRLQGEEAYMVDGVAVQLATLTFNTDQLKGDTLRPPSIYEGSEATQLQVTLQDTDLSTLLPELQEKGVVFTLVLEGLNSQACLLDPESTTGDLNPDLVTLRIANYSSTLFENGTISGEFDGTNTVFHFSTLPGVDFNTPEPTTGTLSLLALAGLCARRRRK